MTPAGALIMTLFGGVWCAAALFNAGSLYGWKIVLAAIPVLLPMGAVLVAGLVLWMTSGLGADLKSSPSEAELSPD